MCHDLSFSASTVEFITDILPNIVIDHQLGIDFSITSHILSMSNKNCLVIISQDGVPHLKQFEWGLIAPYMDTPEKVKKYRTSMANIRAEKILDKKSYWYRIRKNRCLIAVDGIYEHRNINGWKNKVPYYITLADSPKIFLPGLYNYTHIPNPETGELVGTFGIITVDAVEKMKMIHNHGENKHRMPLFMQPLEALEWINESLTDEQMKDFLEYKIPSEQLDACPVYTIRTTKPRPDGKGKIDPFPWPGLPELGNDEPLGHQKALF